MKAENSIMSLGYLSRVLRANLVSFTFTKSPIYFVKANYKYCVSILCLSNSECIYE